MNPSRNRSFDEWDESDVRVRPNKKGSRPRTKERPRYKHAIRGRVVTVDRGRWSVVVDEGTPQERTLIAARARELRRTPIVTGDFVDVVGDISGAKDTLARIFVWESVLRYCAAVPMTQIQPNVWWWPMQTSWSLWLLLRIRSRAQVLSIEPSLPHMMPG